MDFSEYMNLFRRQWKLIVAGVLLGVIVAAGITALTPKRYAANIDFYVGAQAGADPSSAYQAGLLAQEQVKSYIEVLRTERIGQEVSDQIGGALSPSQVVSAISASAEPETVLISAQVVASSPGLALQAADALGRVFPGDVQDLARTNGQTGPSATGARVVHPAVVGQQPTSPDTPVNLVLGLVFGLALGLAAALVRNSLDSSVRTTDDVEKAVTAPVLARISTEPGARSSGPMEPGESSSSAEEYRRLRTALKHITTEHPRPVVVFVSPHGSDGRSSTACNLAIAEGRVGRRVVVLDADLRRSQVADRFGVDDLVGLADLLTGRVGIDQVVRETKDANVWVVPAGTATGQPVDLLDNVALAQVIDGLRQRFDLVLVDTPPLLEYADGSVLAEHSDEVVLVCRYATTSRKDARECVSALRAVSRSVSGAVLNMSPRTHFRHGGHSGPEHAEATTESASPARYGRPDAVPATSRPGS